MKRFFIVLSVLLPLEIMVCSFAQKEESIVWEKADRAEVTSIYEKGIAWFTKTNKYKVMLSYASFTDHNSKIAYERAGGFYKRSGSNFHSSALGIITIQNNQLKISVDTVSKMIVLTNKAKVVDSPMNTENISKIISGAKDVKKIKMSNGYLYRIEFNPNALYDAYEFETDAKGLIRKLNFYYSKEVRKGKDDLKTKPRTEISFSGYETIINSENEFSTKKYFHLEGAKIVLSPQYKNYELKDYRLNEK